MVISIWIKIAEVECQRKKKATGCLFVCFKFLYFGLFILVCNCLFCCVCLRCSFNDTWDEMIGWDVWKDRCILAEVEFELEMFGKVIREGWNGNLNSLSLLFTLVHAWSLLWLLGFMSRSRVIESGDSLGFFLKKSFHFVV